MPSPSRSSFLISPQPTMPQAKMGRTLLVLLWKHFTVRRRQYINTPLELLLPVLFFIILFCTKSLFTQPVDVNADKSEVVMHSEPNDISRLTRPDIILYYPQNNLTDQLMEKVGKALKLRHLDHFTGDKKGYIGSNDNKAISKILNEKYRFAVAFVLFQNMDGEKFPDNLNYTIRLKTDFETQLYEAMDDVIGPHMNFGMNYAEFVRLQWTIDASYLELRTGIPVKQTVSIQEFPYVRTNVSSYIKSLVVILGIGLYFSMGIVFVFAMIRLIEERASGIQELIKMVGVTTKTLGLSHVVNVLPGCLLFSVLGGVLLTVGSPPLLVSSNGFLITLFFALHFISILAWAFVCSYITHNSQHATGLAIFMYVVSLLPAAQVSSRKLPAALLPLAGLLPGVPANSFFRELEVLENFDMGLTFKTMMSSHTPLSLSVAMVFIFLLLQIFLFFMIAWYLSMLLPGKFGTALPWNFFLRKDYWTKNEVHPDSEIDEAYEREKISTESKYFESLPPNSEVGIEIDNVCKSFAKVLALNNVSLPVLKGEITVLLGHNGAGKTTLMSIITGMMSATTGKVYVNGLDTVTQQTAVRSQLGFCPQHNLFFADLTVLEHVMFFCLLKGTLSRQQCTKASLDLLNQLGLEQKANCLSGQLSGGMKRRLQLACALAGDSNVLVLDEPTAGLDVETRRGLWDLLLSLRTGRTVLISTHFMEEADALGDRVAALHRGTLRCYATPMHLKKEIDTGYRLSITLTPDAPQSAPLDISNEITSVLPHATQLSESGVRTLAFSLPSRESAQFPKLFNRLEQKRDRLGIESIGVGVSTLEEVFLKLCSDVSTVTPEDEVDAALQDDIITSRKGGVGLIFSQMAALFVRQIRYSKSCWKMFLATQVVIPLIVLFLVTKMCNVQEDGSKSRNSPALMNLDMYRDMDDRRILSSFDIPLRDRPACCGLRYAHADNIPQTLINIAKDDKIQYNKYLIGVQLNETNAMAYYTTTVRHALPIAMNALTNAIASTLPSDKDITISTVNHPIDDGSFRQQVNIKQPKSLVDTIMWAICIAFFVQTSLLQCLVLPCKERIFRTRHIHIMSGCSPELHWMTSLLYHTALAVLVLVIPTVVFAQALDINHTLTQADLIFPLILVLVGGCLAFVSLAFLASFLMNSDKAAATALFGFTFLFSLITPAMKTACTFDTNSCSYYGDILDFLSYTIPPQTFVEAMLRLATNARLNAYCKLNRDLCPNLLINENGFDSEKCCANQNPRPYLEHDDYSPLIYIVALYIQFLVIINIVFLTERGLVGRLRDRVMTLRYKADQRHKDDELEKEKKYVDEALVRSRGDALLISSVHKHYPVLLGKSVTAVRGVSFAVREGECFGLVGVNGAGKSTTFKMMTCETFPTRGEIVANGQRQHVFGNAKYLNGLGYCPQFFGMDEFLTGRQNLELLLALDGLSSEDAKKEAVRWLELIDLMKYADRPVSAYSGGCSRRLSSVCALARRAPLSLLDEPTAGVDVAARRQLWRCVRAALAQVSRSGHKRAVLITSHSMDEMEALCSRVAIMSGGQLAALGSPAALRAAHNAGLALFIKIRCSSSERLLANADVTDSPSAGTSPELKRLKETCLQYRWTPKDEHRTMLNYHVDKSLKMEYSELFTKLEELRRKFPELIEDYAVTETTLEQVFLTYAKTPLSDDV